MGPAGGLLNGHVRPAEAAPRQQHVPYQRLDGRLTHQTHEEKLLYDGRGDGAERRQAKQQLPEPVELVGVLTPDVLLQSALGLLLEAFHVGHVRQTAGVCRGRRTQRQTAKESVKMTTRADGN